MKIAHMVAFILVIVGAVNWGLVGAGWLAGGADWNVVALISSFIGGKMIEAVIYLLVGVSGVWLAIGHKKDCKVCGGKM